MSTQMHLHHRGDRLVVPFEGELDWPRATAFVDAVDTHLEHYHYRRVELVVASPGGLVAALEHVMRALVRWRTRGVEVRTRVVASAESAAAVLVSLGDERVAAPRGEAAVPPRARARGGRESPHGRARSSTASSRAPTRTSSRASSNARSRPEARSRTGPSPATGRRSSASSGRSRAMPRREAAARG